MGLFEDRSEAAYAAAADAVSKGTASAEQQRLNDAAARQWGSMGNTARAAQAAAPKK